MWTKICGTTNLEDALLAADLGADAVGFIFAPSKRQITPQQVAEITPFLPETLEKIGVFTTQNADEILSAAERAGLTGIQLHSDFDASLIQRLKNATDGRLKVVQVISFAVEGDGEAEQKFEQTLRDVLAEPLVDAILLDTAKGGTSGGTGIVFDWRRAAEIIGRVKPQNSTCRLILAGGLRPENVAEAITVLKPGGVDVVSGVEASPGKKDAGKARDFLTAAHRP